MTSQDSLFYAIFTDKPGGDTPKTDPSEYEFAGVLGMISSSVSDMMSEPGWILIMKPYQVRRRSYAFPLRLRFRLALSSLSPSLFPPPCPSSSPLPRQATPTPPPQHSPRPLTSQRTHVLTHAAGLVMHRILDPTSMGGLGLRRCQWTTTVLNAPSQSAAKRLGYTGEGVLRAIKVLQPGKEGFAGESVFGGVS